MVFDAFDVSEKYQVPVLFRITTRLAHSRSGILRKKQEPQKKLTIPADPLKYVLLPALARKKYRNLLSNYELIKYEIRLSRYNSFEDGKNRSLGIIACGIAGNYLMENFISRVHDYPVLKISAYPFPKDLIIDITSRCREILILEEGYPFVEENIRGILDGGIKIYGRMDGTLPRDGELNPALVAKALGMPAKTFYNVPDIVKLRPPSFCKGCGHADTFIALKEAILPYGPSGVFSDIGCYTLSALPPYSIINSCVDMGASVTMAIGASDAGLNPSVAVIGDSTFTHSGMTGLLDAVVKKSPVTIIISDNSTTGMTGGQNSHATGRLRDICLGLGVEKEHLRVIIPLRKNHAENVRIMREEFDYQGVSVIIAERECIQTSLRKKRAETTAG
jgi:indolepyruvate ferredoxin oxidoreductase alpha subunit